MGLIFLKETCEDLEMKRLLVLVYQLLQESFHKVKKEKLLKAFLTGILSSSAKPREAEN